MLRYTFSSIAAAALLLGAVPSTAGAANLAPIAVSLVVQERCEIQSATTIQQNAAPQVSCLHGAPTGVALAPFDPTQSAATLQPVTQATRPAVWAVSF